MARALPRPAVACCAVLLIVGPVACGGSATAPAGGLVTATAPAPDSTDPGADDNPDDAQAVGAVSAGSAPVDEITQALAAAGVSDPGRWAKVVVAHRPYPADDPTLHTLRRVLVENGAGSAADAIVTALKP